MSTLGTIGTSAYSFVAATSAICLARNGFWSSRAESLRWGLEISTWMTSTGRALLRVLPTWKRTETTQSSPAPKAGEPGARAAL